MSACTDVTGFGLLGHLRNILTASDLSATLSMHALPLLPGACALAKTDRLPGGSRANLAFCEPNLRRVGVEDPALTALAADAQTSGGLLLALPANRAKAAVEELRASKHPAAVIGQLRPGGADAGIVTLDFRHGHESDSLFAGG